MIFLLCLSLYLQLLCNKVLPGLIKDHLGSRKPDTNQKVMLFFGLHNIFLTNFKQKLLIFINVTN